MAHTKFIFRYVRQLTIHTGKTIQKVRFFYVLKLASAICLQLASLYLVYLLTPAEYGQFALIASVAQLMFILTSGWSNGALINLGSQSFSKTGSYKAIVLYRICIVTVSFIAVCILFILLKKPIEEHMKIGGLFEYALILFFGYVFYDHASQLLYPGNLDRTQAGSEFIATLTLLLIVTIAVKNLQGFVFAYTIVFSIFACVVSALFILYFHDHPLEWKWTDFKLVLNYSSWQVIGVTCIYIINMGMNYVLVSCKTPMTDIGTYNLAYRLYSGYAPFFSLFGILIPKWINSSSDIKNLFERKISKIVLFLAALYLAVGCALTPLLQLFEMQKYLASVSYYFLLLPAFLLTSYSNLINTVIANTSRFRRAQFGILLQSGVLATVSFPLVSVFGISGAIAAITLSSTVGAVYFHCVYCKALTHLDA